MKANVLIFINVLLFISCENPTQTYKFRIINNSEKTIYFEKNESIISNVYPDTLIPEQKVQLKVSPHTISYQGGLISIEEVFKKYNIDTLSIYFFDAYVVDNYSWETIREEYKVLKRYDLSIEDIQLLDYEITYPPTEVMKDMRMYPPYEE
ncbi:hypothetical protein MG290_07550 [Flavobacterium sp. CBA20B-1]|uniref:hypothetical protein n=1 Tax=unclassified Flavobacterium TaxID=196869 RepID=UPI0022242A06|nr:MULTISPECIES: hypothetical protein [unclassified Flavobacterium]WCM40833.1 hypothetical protein MG290_07550 [Flavobacterium sp. CBA20B-1]